jgi:hypothetical protein
VSRLNKVNKDRYTVAGRLTPDEIARERFRQSRALTQSHRTNRPVAIDKSRRTRQR